MKGRTKYVFLFFFTVAFLVWAIVACYMDDGKREYVDEVVHIPQIKSFLVGNYSLSTSVSSLPGYHLFIALIAKISSGYMSLRWITLLLSLFSIPIFYLLARKLGAADPLLKTLQFVFFPITFFYFPLVYTDIFSLLLVLAALYLAVLGRHNWSALFSLASFLARQNNILWAAFVWVYGYVSENGFSLAPKKIVSHLRRSLGYVLVFAAFCIFLWLNNGFVIGDRSAHQFGFYMGNVYFFLVLAFLFFLPAFVGSFFTRPKATKTDLLIVCLGWFFALSFFFFPPQTHLYNTGAGWIRNDILRLGYHELSWIYALAIYCGVLTIFKMKFENKAFLVFPFIALYLLPSLLVEQRYLIIPMVLVLLFRKESGAKTEYWLFLHLFLLALAVMYIWYGLRISI